MNGAQLLHASAVALDGAGVLILGASGRGKSSLALRLMALGADLVADDRVWVVSRGAALIARAPDETLGLIEVRGVGILRMRHLDEVALALAVDLDLASEQRLPPLRRSILHGVAVPLISGAGHPVLAEAIVAWLRAEEREGGA